MPCGYKKGTKCPICAKIENKDNIKNYKEVMCESFAKGIYGKKPSELDEHQQEVVVKAIKEDQKENKGQMKKWKNK